MRSSAEAKVTTETLARIAELEERRAHMGVTIAKRTLEERSALRARIHDLQRQEEAEALGDDPTVSAGLIQLIGASRFAHARRIDALDDEIRATKVHLSEQQHAHTLAIKRHRTAQKVAEHVAGVRVQELRHKEQKNMDDLTCARFGGRSTANATLSLQ